jgi:shikimate kinase
MPGVGKSTVGVLLAKRLRYSFIDTDILIQTRVGLKLQEIIDQKGLDRFREIEEQAILSLSCSEHVIATGGSVVYSEKAMKHLNRNGRVCHMELDPQRLKVRLDNINSRGIVMAPGQSIETLYEERHPLYMKHADFTVDCGDMPPNEVLKTMVKSL